MTDIILQLHGSSGSSSGTQSSRWDPNAYQEAVLGPKDGSNQNTVMGNLLGEQGYMNTSSDFRNSATNQINAYNNSALANADFTPAYLQGVQQLSQGTNNLQSLANGQLTQSQLNNQVNAMNYVSKNTIGSIYNNAAEKGIMNGSATIQALKSNSDSLNNQIYQNYDNSLKTQQSINNDLISGAGNQMSLLSSAKNASVETPLSVLNAGIGAYNTASSVMGQGGTTTNTQSGGGSNWLGSLATLGSAALIACFIAGTKVLTRYGEKDIDELKVGDEVTTLVAGNRMTFAPITEVSAPVEQDVYEVITEDKDGNRHFVTTTLTQPFLTEKGDWVAVGNLTMETELKCVGNVKAIMCLGKEVVYDIKVANTNIYFADGFVAYGRIN